MNKKDFSKIRDTLGKTQNQLADILCVSSKAVQSYEEGWRNIPTNIERSMLLLLYFKSSKKLNGNCWNSKKCPEEIKKNCIVWELKTGDFCWYFNGLQCQGKENKAWEKKIKTCQKCEVFSSIFPRVN